METLIALAVIITILITIISIAVVVQAKRTEGDIAINEIQKTLSKVKSNKFTIIIKDESGNIVLEHQIEAH